MDVSRHPISTAQGTLLMTYNSSAQSHKKINTFWLGIAIRFAKEAGAHRYHILTGITAEKRNALKRLWWCCIIRDRILPLGVRRPLQITGEEFNFEEAVPLYDDDFEDEIERSGVYDIPSKRSLTQLFLLLCQLAVALTDVIMVVYPASGQPDLTLSSDHKTDQYLQHIESCVLTLDAWFEHATARFPTPAGIGDIQSSVILYTNLMYIYY